jgi:hypothetical protein
LRLRANVSGQTAVGRTDSDILLHAGPWDRAPDTMVTGRCPRPLHHYILIITHMTAEMHVTNIYNMYTRLSRLALLDIRLCVLPHNQHCISRDQCTHTVSDNDFAVFITSTVTLNTFRGLPCVYQHYYFLNICLY